MTRIRFKGFGVVAVSAPFGTPLEHGRESGPARPICQPVRMRSRAVHSVFNDALERDAIGLNHRRHCWGGWPPTASPVRAEGEAIHRRRAERTQGLLRGSAPRNGGPRPVVASEAKHEPVERRAFDAQCSRRRPASTFAAPRGGGVLMIKREGNARCPFEDDRTGRPLPVIGRDVACVAFSRDVESGLFYHRSDAVRPRPRHDSWDASGSRQSRDSVNRDTLPRPTEGLRHELPFMKGVSNTSARPGAQGSSQAIQRRESMFSGRSRSLRGRMAGPGTVLFS